MMTIRRRVLVSASRDSVRSYLGDLGELVRYESKVSVVEPESCGQAHLSGRFFGLPWNARFRFERAGDGGWRGVMISGPLRRMETTVSLRAVSGGTLVERADAYDLPWLLKPLSAALKPALGRALEAALGLVKERAEALHRRRQLQELDA